MSTPCRAKGPISRGADQCGGEVSSLASTRFSRASADGQNSDRLTDHQRVIKSNMCNFGVTEVSADTSEYGNSRYSLRRILTKHSEVYMTIATVCGVRRVCLLGLPHPLNLNPPLRVVHIFPTRSLVTGTLSSFSYSHACGFSRTSHILKSNLERILLARLF